MSQSPDFLVHGDTLTISCAVRYDGILAPDFIWHPAPDRIQPLVNTGSSVNSTVQVRAPAFPGSVQPYGCYVTFDGSVFSLVDNRTSAAVKTSGE